MMAFVEQSQIEFDDPILSPSSAPILTGGAKKEKNFITDPGQVCFERVLPSESHYYKTPPPPVCTG